MLKESPGALGYLARRRIDHPEALDAFRLGYAERSLGLRLPDKRRKEGAEIRGRLEKLGIFRASGHEHFAGSLVIPVLGEHGHVSEVYGRKTGEHLRAGTPAHLYLPGPHRGVFNLAALAASDEIIVCESLIDALTFWCAGFRHDTYGAGGFTAGHQRAFREHQVRRVLIAYDRDDAGEKAARDLAADLTASGVECFRVEFPAGADVNDVAVAARNPADALGRAIRSASWMGAGSGPARRRNAPLRPGSALVSTVLITSPVTGSHSVSRPATQMGWRHFPAASSITRSRPSPDVFGSVIAASRGSGEQRQRHTALLAGQRPLSQARAREEGVSAMRIGLAALPPAAREWQALACPGTCVQVRPAGAVSPVISCGAADALRNHHAARVRHPPAVTRGIPQPALR